MATKAEYWRLFIAVPVPEEVKRTALENLSLPQHIRSGIRWVRPENMHLTLAFIGEMAVAAVDGLKNALTRGIGKRSPIPLLIDRYGAFPNAHEPRVLWAGAAQEPESLLEVQREVENVLQASRIPFDHKPFHPHLTLGRSKEPRQLDDLSEYLESVAIVGAQQFTLRELHLYRSQFDHNGPFYTILETVAFA